MARLVPGEIYYTILLSFTFEIYARCDVVKSGMKDRQPLDDEVG